MKMPTQQELLTMDEASYKQYKQGLINERKQKIRQLKQKIRVRKKGMALKMKGFGATYKAVASALSKSPKAGKNKALKRKIRALQGQIQGIRQGTPQPQQRRSILSNSSGYFKPKEQETPEKKQMVFLGRL